MEAQKLIKTSGEWIVTGLLTLLGAIFAESILLLILGILFALIGAVGLSIGVEDKQREEKEIRKMFGKE